MRACHETLRLLPAGRRRSISLATGVATGPEIRILGSLFFFPVFSRPLARPRNLGHIGPMKTGLAVWLTAGLFTAAMALAGCSDGVGEPVHAVYVVPESLDALSQEAWFDHPWPSDVRVEDGSPVFRGFFNPGLVRLVDEYVSRTDGLLDGFSPVGGGYFRFDGAIDRESVPVDPAETLDVRASVQLIDVDPASPTVGQRHPILVSFRAPGGKYLVPNTLRWLPAFGFPLRPHTRYAAIVTHTLRADGGGDVLASAELEEVLGIVPATGPRIALAEEVAPALDVIDGTGTRRQAIRQLAVFTTGDPSAELLAIADHVRREVPAPDFIARDPWDVVKYDPDYTLYRARFGPIPNYQQGTVPYSKPEDGGDILFEDGVPVVANTYEARFAISIPKPKHCEMPAAGYPIVLYAHGTGGNYESFASDETANALAAKCLAVMGVDQIFHGDRPGAPADPDQVDFIFFNVQNVAAIRNNNRQSAIDEVQRARLFTERHVEIPADVSVNGQAIKFDSSKVMFFGHSQGGLNGPLFLAADDSVRGAVLSGSGSMLIITLLSKTEPTPSLAELVANLLALDLEEKEELDFFHPALMVAQSIADPVDPIHYARYTVPEPRAGFLPKSILMTEGIGADGNHDHYTPPEGTEAQAIAMGLPLQLPAQHVYPQLGYGAAAAVEIPAEGLRGNLGGGLASGVLAQWAPAPDHDGHFVVFRVPQANEQAAEFLRRLADDPVGSVPAP
jgi:hypothetical protein